MDARRERGDERHRHNDHPDENEPREHAGIAVAGVEALRDRKAHAPVERGEAAAHRHGIRVLGEQADKQGEEAHAGGEDAKTRRL